MGRKSVESLRGQDYEILVEVLVEAQEASGLTRKQVCDNVSRPKNYFYKIVHGERRLDIVEFYELCEGMNADPMVLLKRFSQLRSAISS
jgi:hypothetical protein